MPIALRLTGEKKFSRLKGKVLEGAHCLSKTRVMKGKKIKDRHIKDKAKK